MLYRLCGTAARTVRIGATGGTEQSSVVILSRDGIRFRGAGCRYISSTLCSPSGYKNSHPSRPLADAPNEPLDPAGSGPPPQDTLHPMQMNEPQDPGGLRKGRAGQGARPLAPSSTLNPTRILPPIPLPTPPPAYPQGLKICPCHRPPRSFLFHHRTACSSNNSSRLLWGPAARRSVRPGRATANCTLPT